MDSIAREANRLYWESDMAVAEIASELELSRRALYEAVEPLHTGGPCAACGGALVWPNRSARASGRAECAECGTPAEAPAPDRGAGGAVLAETEAEPEGLDALRRQVTETLAAPGMKSALLLGGGLLVGVAAGMAAARFWSRRR